MHGHSGLSPRLRNKQVTVVSGLRLGGSLGAQDGRPVQSWVAVVGLRLIELQLDRSGIQRGVRMSTPDWRSIRLMSLPPMVTSTGSTGTPTAAKSSSMAPDGWLSDRSSGDSLSSAHAPATDPRRDRSSPRRRRLRRVKLVRGTSCSFLALLADPWVRPPPQWACWVLEQVIVGCASPPGECGVPCGQNWPLGAGRVRSADAHVPFRDCCVGTCRQTCRWRYSPPEVPL